MWTDKYEFHKTVISYTKHLSANAMTEMITQASPTKCIFLNGTLAVDFLKAF